jgi:hypothetical protein
MNLLVTPKEKNKFASVLNYALCGEKVVTSALDEGKCSDTCPEISIPGKKLSVSIGWKVGWADNV